MTSNISTLSLLRIGSATLLLIGLILIPFFLFGAAVERESLAFTAQGQSGIALAGAALLALDIVLPVPSSLLATAIGAALGAWLGTLVNTVGLTAGCLAGLAIGRSGSPLARRILGGALFQLFAEKTERYGIVAILVMRAVPVLAEASIVAVGAGRGRIGPAIAASTCANLCLGAVYAFAGAAAGAGIAPPGLAVATAMIVPALGGLGAWLWLRRSAASAPPRPNP